MQVDIKDGMLVLQPEVAEPQIPEVSPFGKWFPAILLAGTVVTTVALHYHSKLPGADDKTSQMRFDANGPLSKSQGRGKKGKTKVPLKKHQPSLFAGEAEKPTIVQKGGKRVQQKGILGFVEVEDEAVPEPSKLEVLAAKEADIEARQYKKQGRWWVYDYEGELEALLDDQEDPGVVIQRLKTHTGPNPYKVWIGGVLYGWTDDDFIGGYDALERAMAAGESWYDAPDGEKYPMPGIVIDDDARAFLTEFWLSHPDLRQECLNKYGFDPIDQEAEYWREGLAEPEHADISKKVMAQGFTLDLAEEWAEQELTAIVQIDNLEAFRKSGERYAKKNLREKLESALLDRDRKGATADEREIAENAIRAYKLLLRELKKPLNERDPVASYDIDSYVKKFAEENPNLIDKEEEPKKKLEKTVTRHDIPRMGSIKGPVLIYNPTYGSLQEKKDDEFLEERDVWQQSYVSTDRPLKKSELESLQKFGYMSFYPDRFFLVNGNLPLNKVQLHLAQIKAFEAANEGYINFVPGPIVDVINKLPDIQFGGSGDNAQKAIKEMLMENAKMKAGPAEKAAEKLVAAVRAVAPYPDMKDLALKWRSCRWCGEVIQQLYTEEDEEYCSIECADVQKGRTTEGPRSGFVKHLNREPPQPKSVLVKEAEADEKLGTGHPPELPEDVTDTDYSYKDYYNAVMGMDPGLAERIMPEWFEKQEDIITKKLAKIWNKPEDDEEVQQIAIGMMESYGLERPHPEQYWEWQLQEVYDRNRDMAIIDELYMPEYVAHYKKFPLLSQLRQDIPNDMIFQSAREVFARRQWPLDNPHFMHNIQRAWIVTNSDEQPHPSVEIEVDKVRNKYPRFDIEFIRNHKKWKITDKEKFKVTTGTTIPSKVGKSQKTKTRTPIEVTQYTWAEHPVDIEDRIVKYLAEEQKKREEFESKGLGRFG